MISGCLLLFIALIDLLRQECLKKGVHGAVATATIGTKTDLAERKKLWSWRLRWTWQSWVICEFWGASRRVANLAELRSNVRNLTEWKILWPNVFFNKIVFSLLRHDYAAVLKKFLEPRHIRMTEVSHFGAWNKARRPLFKNSPLDFPKGPDRKMKCTGTGIAYRWILW